MYNNPPKTLFVGQTRVYLPVCHSTNDIAAELLQNPSTTEGTVVVTSHQTHGRGQRGNSWQAEPGKNLTFSLILKPLFVSAVSQFQLNIAVSLAVHDFLQFYLPSGLRIKWPNDVYWRDTKLGGILIESTIKGTQLTQSVVGIGLNINQMHFPPDLRATSLRQATSMEDEYNLEILLNALLESLEKRYLQLRAGNFVLLERYYLQNLYSFGEKQQFRSQNQIFTGVINGIDESGRLQIETGNEIRSFGFKEIEFLFA